jgi:hypothetical protein
MHEMAVCVLPNRKPKVFESADENVHKNKKYDLSELLSKLDCYEKQCLQKQIYIRKFDLRKAF